MIEAEALESTAGLRRRALQLRFDTLLNDGARDRYWLACEKISRLLDRTSAEVEGVAQQLLARAESQIEALSDQLRQAQVLDGGSSHRPKTHSLMALISEAQPEAPSYSESSQGAAFDEYLQQQESNILESMVGEAEGVKAAAVAPALIRANRYLRHRQLQQSASRLVDVAIDCAPDNPGPLNPEMLSIKSLKLMRDLSPQYLNRFVAYIDSLLWIEESAEALFDSKSKQKLKKKKSV